MIRHVVRNAIPSAVARPVTAEERIDWKRDELEEAVQRLAADRYRSPAYVEAVISRYGELVALRELQARQPIRGRPAEPPFGRGIRGARP